MDTETGLIDNIAGRNWGKVDVRGWVNVVLLFGIIFVGALLRLAPLLSAGFPLNDGGLFYEMVRDLQANNYHLPLYTTYNNLNIPFAYPPLAFFIAGWLNDYLKIDLLVLFRFLPVIFSILTIPVVYLLAREFFENEVAFLATFTFALLVPGYQWLIVGGGLTRSPAFFTGTIALWVSLKWFKSGHLRYAVLTGVCLGVTLLFHLEIAWVTFVSTVVIGFFKGRLKRILRGTLIAVPVMLMVSAPYWLTMLARYGVSIFARAMGTGNLFAFNIILTKLIFNNYTQESYFTPFAVFALLGWIYSLMYGEKCLSIWVLVLLFLGPRSINRSISIPVAYLSTVGIVNVLSPVFRAPRGQYSTGSPLPGSVFAGTSPLFKGMVLISYVTLIFNAYYNPVLDDPLKHLPKADLAAFGWLSSNIPMESEVWVVSCASDWAVDLVSEWFPALARRKSILTVQGTEWLPNGEFARMGKAWAEIRFCYRDENALSCLEEYARKHALNYTHIYLSAPDSSWSCSDGGNLYRLKHQLEQAAHYRKIYSEKQVVIFAREEQNTLETDSSKQ